MALANYCRETAVKLSHVASSPVPSSSVLLSYVMSTPVKLANLNFVASGRVASCHVELRLVKSCLVVSCLVKLCPRRRGYSLITSRASPIFILIDSSISTDSTFYYKFRSTTIFIPTLPHKVNSFHIKSLLPRIHP
jgi:hypothetical protein